VGSNFSLAISMIVMARARVSALVSAPFARQGFGKAKMPSISIGQAGYSPHFR
jgi:hypothetical protein